MKRKRQTDEILSQALYDSTSQSAKGYQISLKVDESGIFDYDELIHKKYSIRDLKGMLA